MSKWPAAAKFQVSNDALSRAFGGKLALVHMKSKRVHVLNQTGTRLWEGLSAGDSRGEIQKAILSEFEVDENELSGEIDGILTALIDEDLIHLLP